MTSAPGITRPLTEAERLDADLAAARSAVLMFADLYGEALNEGRRADVGVRRGLKALEGTCRAWNRAMNAAMEYRDD